MPTYTLRNIYTDEVFEEYMSYSELQEYLKDKPNIEQILSAPAIVSGISKKPDSGFRDILKNIKKEHSRGLTRSTVNTF